MNQRYIVVRYPSGTIEFTKEGSFRGHLPIHELLGTYHWARLNSEYVLAVGDFHIGNGSILMNHPEVHVLPHVASSQSLVQHALKANKSSHVAAMLSALSNFDLGDKSTMSDLVDILESRFGPVFAPSR